MLFGSSTTIINTDEDEQQQPAKPAPPPAQVPTRTEPAPDPLDQAIRENIRRRDAAEATRMRGAAVQADAVTPDRAARTKQIERQTGVPYAIVDRNYDELDCRARIDAVPYGQVQTQTPALAAWASDPANAAVAKDDMERLGYLEWLMKAPQRFWARKDAQDRVAELRSKQLFFGVGALTRAERDALWVEQQYAHETSRFGAGDTWWSPRGLVAGAVEFTQNTVGMVREAGPIAALGAGVGGLTGAAVGAAGGTIVTPGAGTAVGAYAGGVAGARYGFGVGLTAGSAKRGFTLEAGGALDEFLDPQWQKDFGQPMDEDVARAAALAAGTINAGVESLQFTRLLKSFPALSKLQGVFTRNAIKHALRNPTVRSALKDVMLNYGKTLTFEVATEVGQRAVTILAGEMGKWVDDKGATMRGQGEWSEELWQEAVGALQTFAVGVAAGPATGLARDVGRARRAQAYEGLFNAIAEGVSDSPSVQRAPESVQEFIKTATKDGPVEHVYIDEDKFSEYFQSKNMNPATVAAELTGNPNALAEARTTGEAIAIPTAVYGTRVAANHHVGLAGDLRIGPQGPMEMTPKEATALREALVASQKAQAEQEQAAAEGRPAGPPTPRQTLGELFRAIGVSDKRTAAYAHYLSNIFETLAQRAQVDPQTLFRRYGLRMERPGYAPATQTQEQEPGATPPPGAPPAGSAAPPGGAVPDSVLSAFPDMPEGEGGLLPLARFTGEEQAALEAAGLVTEATTSDGTTYRGVDPATLWPLRQARAAEGTTREPQLTPEGEALLARRRAAAGADPPMPLLQPPLHRPPSPPRQPKLLQGQSYQVVLRNLWRLLNSGYSLEQARPLVLKLARLTVFPPRPATFSPSSFLTRSPLGTQGQSRTSPTNSSTDTNAPDSSRPTSRRSATTTRGGKSSSRLASSAASTPRRKARAASRARSNG